MDADRCGQCQRFNLRGGWVPLQMLFYHISYKPAFPNFSPSIFPLKPVKIKVSEFVIGTASEISETINKAAMVTIPRKRK